jgi:hypothetical protein
MALFFLVKPSAAQLYSPPRRGDEIVQESLEALNSHVTVGAPGRQAEAVLSADHAVQQPMESSFVFSQLQISMRGHSAGEQQLMTIHVLAEVGPPRDNDRFLVEASTHHDACRPSMAYDSDGLAHCRFQLGGGEVVAEGGVARWQGRPDLHSATNEPCRPRGDPRVDPGHQAIEWVMIRAHGDEHLGEIG